MELVEFIQKVKEGLKTGKYINEAAISQQVLLPLMRRLGWPDDDPEVVRPEYSVGGKRVDYALFNQWKKPIIFIEVKKVGRIEGGDTQLFEYAYNEGIPMAILTDGQEWSFYLPGEPGGIPDRCIYKLDILERDIEESISRFNRYLKYERVCEGKAFIDAKEDYQDKTKNREMEKTLPKAWRKILEEQDSILVDLLAETVSDLCGYTPDPDMIGRFIKNLIQPSITKQTKGETNRQRKREGDTTQEQQIKHRRIGEYGFVLFGKKYSTTNTARAVMIEIFEKLIENDPRFLNRFKSIKHGRKRQYVSDTKEGLYPGNPKLAQNPIHSHCLSTGDYIGTNYSKNRIREIVKLAAEVAGIQFDVDLVIYFGDEDI